MWMTSHENELPRSIRHHYLFGTMWPFFPTRSVFLSKTIPVSRSHLLSILHDPEQVLRVSPLFISLIPDPPKDPSSDSPTTGKAQWYTITERLPMLGGLYESSTTFRCRYERTEDGYDAEVLAGAGTHLMNEARVRDADGEGEGVVFEEKLVVTGLFFLMPYIVSTMTTAHIAALDIIAEKALQKN
ncbi:hypothetical protein GALMADRAFT_314814 [Galerina marginata CBS 339.88]|uniref:DUF7053 domain-containing protein n=1 Tax=Galerina marginata (strain CBS 339.88) TaxID=685588 RepID=A0A067TPB5_GALM3|nr:hypothetical protein GALMADRAFT_314814 [Galerina marginata CBS 339.88]